MTTKNKIKVILIVVALFVFARNLPRYLEATKFAIKMHQVSGGNLDVGYRSWCSALKHLK